MLPYGASGVPEDRQPILERLYRYYSRILQDCKLKIATHYRVADTAVPHRRDVKHSALKRKEH